MSDETVQLLSGSRTGSASERFTGLRLALRGFCMSLGLTLAPVGCAHAGTETKGIPPSNQTESLRIQLSYEGATEARLCIPANLDYSILPQDQSVTFPVQPMSDGKVHFLYKHESRSFAHVERVRVALVRTTELWKEILAEMRASPERDERSGFIFKTIFRTDGSQTYMAASNARPVNLLIFLRNDGASRGLRKAQLSNIASSINEFIKTKECDSNVR